MPFIHFPTHIFSSHFHSENNLSSVSCDKSLTRYQLRAHIIISQGAHHTGVDVFVSDKTWSQYYASCSGLCLSASIISRVVFTCGEFFLLLFLYFKQIRKAYSAVSLSLCDSGHRQMKLTPINVAENQKRENNRLNVIVNDVDLFVKPRKVKLVCKHKS